MTNPLLSRPYDRWYAAALFLDAGHPRDEVLWRLGLDEEGWLQLDRLYDVLVHAGAAWVRERSMEAGLGDPVTDPAVLAAALNGIEVSIAAEDAMQGARHAFRAVRREVEKNPHIGPFRDAPWVAGYLCERRWPNLRYVHNGRQVCVRGKPLADKKGVPIEGIDVGSFQALGERWFRDAQRVYGQGETPSRIFWYVVKGADVDTFRALNARYGVDKIAGYYCTNHRFPTAEPGSFEVVGYDYSQGQKPGFHVEESHYARDSRHAYGYGKIIEGADGGSFASIGDEGVYFVDSQRVYFEVTPVAGADRDSFTPASGKGQFRAYDRHQPYHRGRAESVSEAFDSWRDYFESRPEITDSWWHREAHRRADAQVRDGAGLRPLGGPYCTDGQRVFAVASSAIDASPVSLDHLDLASFVHLADVFAADRLGLRYVLPGYEDSAEPPVKGGDPVSFVALGDGWYRDSRQVYFLGAQSPDAALKTLKVDAASFILLGGPYAADKSGLIFAGARKRKMVDVTGMRWLGGDYLLQEGEIIYQGKAVPRSGALDVATAHGIHRDVLIDAKGAMLVQAFYRKPVKGLQPDKLQFINECFAVDEHRVYGLTYGYALHVCELADRASVVADGRWSIKDRHGSIHLGRSGITFERR